MYTRKLKILHLEDMPSDAELVHRTLLRSKLDFDILLTDNRDGFLYALENYQPDFILSDHSLPSFNSIEALKIIKEKKIETPFILITSTISEEFAVEVMKLGAWDYILKDRMQRLPMAIQNALDKYQLDTERKRMLDQIIANEALYKEAENIAHFGTWRSNPITGEMFLSDGSFRLMGFEPGELTSDRNTIRDRIHLDDLKKIDALITDATNESKILSIDYRIKAKDDSIKYLDTQFMVSWEHGIAMSITGFNRDITKQREAEIKRAETETQYKHLFENNPLPMWVTDNETYQIIDVNKAAIDHYGFSRAEFLSMNALQLRPDSEKDRFLKMKSFPADSSNAGIWKHLKKDGSIIDVNIFGHGINYDGRPARLILSNDITEVQRSHEKLELAHKTQSSILNALPANIALLDNSGTIIAVNRGWETFNSDNYLKSLNYNIGENYLQVSTKADTEDITSGIAIAEGIREVIEGHIDCFHTEYSCHTSERKKWYRVEVAKLNDEKDAGVVVMHIDVTDRKQAELAANELNDQLSQSASDIRLQSGTGPIFYSHHH